MLKPIRYVYYRILLWKLSDRRENTPVLVAGLATSLLLTLNVMLTFMFINELSGRPPLPPLRFGLVAYLAGAIAFAAAAGAMNVAWVANGGFDKLQQEFRAAAPARESVRTVLFWSYIVLSVAAPLVFAILWRPFHI